MWPTALIIASVALLALLVLWVMGQRRQLGAVEGARFVPDWAGFLSLEQYRAFMDSVEQVLVERELEAVERDGVVALALPDGRPLQLGLQNLAQRCAQVEQERWVPLMEAHLDALLGAEAEAEAIDRSDFEAVRSLLKVRLYPAEAVDNTEADAVVLARPADGLAAVLVYDLPSTVVSVPPEEVAAWDRSEEELLAVGLENLAAEPLPKREEVEVERGVLLRVFSGASFFVASQVLHMERLVGRNLPYGALVSAPTRHIVLVHLIRDSRVLMAINAMIPRAYVAHQQGPGSLVPSLYWYHEDQLTLLPTTVESDAVKFTPPAEFVKRVMEPMAAQP